MGSKKGSHGSTLEQVHRGFGGGTRPLGTSLERALLGQLANPPDTAISVPMQQAVTNAQMGPAGMSHVFGIGADQSQLPGSLQAGLQSREQLGLPDRRTYFSFLPTPDQLTALGAVPGIGPTPEGKRAAKRLPKLEEKGTPGAERKAEKIKKRHPEL